MSLGLSSRPSGPRCVQSARTSLPSARTIAAARAVTTAEPPPSAITASAPDRWSASAAAMTDWNGTMRLHAVESPGVALTDPRFDVLQQARHTGYRRSADNHRPTYSRALQFTRQKDESIRSAERPKGRGCVLETQHVVTPQARDRYGCATNPTKASRTPTATRGGMICR